MNNFSRSASLSVAFLGSLFFAATAHADYMVTMLETSGNVVATGSGSFSLVGMTPVAGGSSTILLPSFNFLATGTGTAGSGFSIPAMTISGGNLGTGSTSFVSNSQTGDFVVFQGFIPQLNLPTGYSSGTLLSSQSTWSGRTFSSLGLTPGTHTYKLGSVPTADIFTIQVGAAVPEPSSLLMVGIGTCVWTIASRRRKKNS